jgi:phosphonate transport system substrate-binding protein
MFWKINPFLVLMFMLALLLFVGACANGNSSQTKQEAGKEKEGPFLIGVIPAQGSSQMQDGTDKLAEILSEKLGREVKAEIYPDYNGVVEAMGADKLHMAYLGPLTYVEAHERYDVKAIVTQLINGEPFYYSYLIVPSDSAYASIDDVIKQSADIRFAFGDINSTSGSLIPGIALKKAGVFVTQQDHEFKSVTYTGEHLATALAIQNKTQDAGAMDSAYYNRLVRDGKVDGSKIKVIWQSEPLFQYPWAVIESTPDADIKIIQDTMLTIQDKDILDAFGGASGFTLAKNEDYAAIRQAAISDGRMKPRE